VDPLLHPIGDRPHHQVAVQATRWLVTMEPTPGDPEIMRG
jgi:hypothetical protein